MSDGTSSEGATGSGFVSRSHRAIAPFDLRRPADLADALAAVAAGGAPHAGGIDLVRSLRLGRRVDEVVPLAALDELHAIEVVDDRLRLGAAITHSAIERDPLIARTRPDLAAAWRTVGNVRIRRTGTVGGNLIAFDKDYDAAPILTAADAELVIAGPDGSDRLPVADLTPERVAGRLLVRIEVPTSGRVVFDRSLKPVVSVAVGDRTVAVGCAHRAPVVVPRPAGDPHAGADAVAAAAPEPIDDAFASAGYRRRMIEVLVRRALATHAEVAP